MERYSVRKTVEEYQYGYNAHAVAERLGIPVETVCFHLGFAGVALRPKDADPTLQMQHGLGRRRQAASARKHPSLGSSFPTLAAAHPDLAAEWDTQANGPLGQTSSGSGKVVRWLCGNCGCGFDKRVRVHVKNPSCPHCGPTVRNATPLAQTHPVIARSWCPDANETPECPYGSKSRKMGHWCCEDCGHRWQATVGTRVRSGCPACTGKVASPTNNLAVTHPALAAEWNTPGMSSTEVLANTSFRANWCCSDCQHEWDAPVYRRAMDGHGCPACAGNVVTDTNNVAVRAPALAAEWNTERNERTPAEVTCGSAYAATWTCSDCSYHWQAAVVNRFSGDGCPACVSGPKWTLPKLSRLLQQTDTPTVAAAVCAMRDAGVGDTNGSVRSVYETAVAGTLTLTDLHKLAENQQTPAVAAIVAAHRPDDFGGARRSVPRSVRSAVLARDNHRCCACGSSEHLAMDHILPYVSGGEDTVENLQTLCRSCNSIKGTRDMDLEAIRRRRAELDEQQVAKAKKTSCSRSQRKAVRSAAAAPTVAS